MGVPDRMRTLHVASFGIGAPHEVALGQNAPRGVEMVHYECMIDIESNDRGNDTL